MPDNDRVRALRKRLVHAVLAVLVFAGAGTQTGVAALPAGSLSVYAAATGSGRACTPTDPCSIRTAQSVARSKLALGARGGAVHLAAGEYRLRSPIRLTAADSGVAGAPVRWVGPSSGEATLTSAIRVRGWTRSQIPGVWRAAVPKGMASTRLSVDGKAATLARGSAKVLGTLRSVAAGFTFTNAAVKKWPGISDLRLDFEAGGQQRTKHGAWTDSSCSVARRAGSTLVMAQPCFSIARDSPRGPGVNLPSYIENNVRLLDRANEFYVDTRKGVLYYKPSRGTTMRTADVELPTMPTLMTISGTQGRPAHDIRIERIAFRNTTWSPSRRDGMVPLQANQLLVKTAAGTDVTAGPSALELDTTRGVTVMRSRFIGLGGGGISSIHGDRVSVLTSRFRDISSNGISIGVANPFANPTAPRVETGYRVEGNTITDVSNRYLGGVGILATYASRLSVKDNELSDLPYTAISVGWGWGNVRFPTVGANRIERNRISRVMTSRLSDGGGIYVMGHQPGGVIRANVIDDVRQVYGAIYLDAGSTDWSISSNVLTRVSRTNWVFVTPYGAAPAVNNTVTSNYTDSRRRAVDARANRVGANVESRTRWPALAARIRRDAG